MEEKPGAPQAWLATALKRRSQRIHEHVTVSPVANGLTAKRALDEQGAGAHGQSGTRTGCVRLRHPVQRRGGHRLQLPPRLIARMQRYELVGPLQCFFIAIQ